MASVLDSAAAPDGSMAASGSCGGWLAPGAASLPLMPHEVWAAIAFCLTATDVGQVAPCCKVLGQEAADVELWFHLFMRSCWPPCSALLAFAEDGAACPAGVDWRARLRARAAAVPTIVVDVGRGYTKYTVVHGVNGRMEGDRLAPRLVQLCSSPTHPADCNRSEQLRFIQAELDKALLAAALDPQHRLHSAALAPGMALMHGRCALIKDLQARPELNGRIVRLRRPSEDRWGTELLSFGAPANAMREAADGGAGAAAPGGPQGLLLKPENLVPVRRAADLPLLVGEPFWATANRNGQELSASEWARGVQAQVGERAGPVRIAPEAQMSLWAHGIDHGIVVNIGQGQTIALPVVSGEVAVTAVNYSELGSGQLTMEMVRLLSQRFSFVDNGLMTWCRDMKEMYCYVAPPAPSTYGKKSLRARLAAGDDFGLQRIEVECPHSSETVELAEERILVPELFFESFAGQPSLPELIVGCAERVLARGLCGEEGVRALLRQVVLVGGAADFPGLRPRTEFEVRALLRERASTRLRAVLESPEDAFVLNPPLGDGLPLTTPRFVPLVGGCVRAASSFKFEEWRTGESAALESLPFRDTLDERLERTLMDLPGATRWLQRRLPNLNGPAIFRTGGGGGEDDNVWQMFGLEGLGLDGEEEDSSGSSEEEEEAGEGPPDEPMRSPSDCEAACSEPGEDSEEQPPPWRAGPGNAGGRRRRPAAGTSAPNNRGAQGRTSGKGKGRGGGRSGRGPQRVWRPVQR